MSSTGHDEEKFWEVAGFESAHPPAPAFAPELLDITTGFVFDQLWARPGLDQRSRSLLTLGILIALRAREELRYHFPIGLRNGLSVEELEEVVYHAAGYAGFPAAHLAQMVADEVLAGHRPGRQA